MLLTRELDVRISACCCSLAGTGGSDRSEAELLEDLAVYIANLFFLTSDTAAVIVKDTELSQEDFGKSSL